MTDERTELLIRARELILESISLIESARDGHCISAQADETVVKLRDLADSDLDPGSLRNMIRTFETDENAPGWSRPLASVKNVVRKGI